MQPLGSLGLEVAPLVIVAQASVLDRVISNSFVDVGVGQTFNTLNSL